MTMRTWSGLAAALLGLASVASAQRFGFTHQMLPANNDDTTAVALGDVDGDGDLDAFVGNSGYAGPPRQNRLYLDGGTGIFTDVTATNLPVLLDYTNAVALGDVDGDGDLDAFVGNGGAGSGLSGGLSQNRLYLNGGTGVFTDVTATNLPALTGNTKDVALGDVDGDGDLDAFVGIGRVSGRGGV